MLISKVNRHYISYSEGCQALSHHFLFSKYQQGVGHKIPIKLELRAKFLVDIIIARLSSWW